MAAYMKPVKSGTPPMRKSEASGIDPVSQPKSLNTSIAVPTTWKMKMTLASSQVSSLQASMTAWMAMAASTKKS